MASWGYRVSFLPQSVASAALRTTFRPKIAITTIKARLNSTPSTQFVVRFFSNPSNEDEGKKYLGQMSVDTDANGNTGTFTFSPEQRVGLGQRITATATDPANNTSEFSAPCEVKGGVIGGL
jgi:hypothetical protein